MSTTSTLSDAKHRPERAHGMTIWLAMLDASVQWVDVNGVSTRIAEAGSGVPVLLLHGTGGHIETFTHNIGPLSNDFRVIAVDMLGHGFTDRPDLPYTIPDYTAHLLGLMDVLGIERAHLVGQSLGGWVASWLALEQPSRVLRVVNCTGGGLRWPEGESTEEDDARRAGVKSGNRVAERTTLDTVAARLARLLHRKELLTQELVDTRFRIYSQEGWSEHYKRIAHMLPYDNPDRIRYSLTEERLRQIHVPLLYLWTDHNPGTSADSAERAHAVTPDSEYTLMEDCGHWPQWENPGLFNDIVSRYLSGQSVST